MNVQAQVIIDMIERATKTAGEEYYEARCMLEEDIGHGKKYGINNTRTVVIHRPDGSIQVSDEDRGWMREEVTGSKEELDRVLYMIKDDLYNPYYHDRKQQGKTIGGRGIKGIIKRR